MSVLMEGCVLPFRYAGSGEDEKTSYLFLLFSGLHAGDGNSFSDNQARGCCVRKTEQREGGKVFIAAPTARPHMDSES